MSNIVKNLVGLAFGAWVCVGAQTLEGVKAPEPQLQWVRSLNATPPAPLAKPVVLTVVVTPPPNAASANAPAPNPAQSSLPAQSHSDTGWSSRDLSPQKWAILLSDKTLYRTLRRWSQEAQYQLLWQVDRDYPIEAEITFENTLREAVAQVMGGVALTDYPLQAIFNPTTRVLRVVRHMDENER